MIPEPLKDKIFTSEVTSCDDSVFDKQDIKLAVEWFIQNLRGDVNKSGAITLIKEAFEDVIKK